MNQDSVNQDSVNQNGMNQDDVNQNAWMTDVLLRLLNTPSPTGFTEQAVSLIETELRKLGVQPRRSRKGALSWTVPGMSPEARHLALSAHTDTLGAMVKAILPGGRLRLSQLGSYDWATIEGEYVTVHLQSGSTLSGTVVNEYQSLHVWGNTLRELRRDAENLELRLDALHDGQPLERAADTRALGVQVGDFVSFEPRAVLTPSGYLKSRHLDDKACVAILLDVTRQLLLRPAPMTVSGYVTTYEEVGHGAAPGFGDADELIALDMAAVGRGQQSSEHHATLCIKDSSGPYDFGLSTRLRTAAQRAGIELKTDIYPQYSSDASAAWRAGHDLPAALIGPGVDASHAYERTHLDALDACVKLLLTYCHT